MEEEEEEKFTYVGHVVRSENKRETQVGSQFQGLMKKIDDNQDGVNSDSGYNGICVFLFTLLCVSN